MCSEILHEIHELLETAPSDVPPESQYLLELDHSTLYNASYEEQAYRVLALKAAQRAGQRKLHKGGVGEDLNAPKLNPLRLGELGMTSAH